MRPSRSALAWGVALVVFGVVLLLRNTGAIAEDVSAWPWAVLAAGLALLAHPAGRRGSDIAVPLALVIIGGLFALREVGALPAVPVVPVVLIVIGVAVLVAGLSRTGVAEPERLVVPLDGAAGARLVLQYGAGTLRVAGKAADGVAVEGTFVGGVRHEASRRDDRLDVTLRHPSDVEGLLRGRRPLDWDVAVNDAVPLDLEVQSGASRMHLDLTGLRLTALALKTGASDTDVVLPDRGRYAVDIDAGAAEVTVRVPQGIAASIRTRSALATVDVDQARFPRANGGYRSPGYDDAEHRVDIDIEGGVASFTVR